MSKAFNQIRPRLGLDDQLTFGKYQGWTVLEVLEENPKYIAWLIREGKPVYLSVLEETTRKLDLLDNKQKPEDFFPEVYFDDVPF